MSVQEVILAVNPHRPVDFNAKAIQAVLDESYLIADTKKDGVRLNLIVGPRGTNSVDWLSREGKRFPVLEKFGEPLHNDTRWGHFFNPHLGEGLFQQGFMLDCELIIDNLPCKDTAGTLRRWKTGPLDSSRLNVFVFAIVPLDVVTFGLEYDCTNALMKTHVEYQVAVLKKEFPEINWVVCESFDVFSMEELELRFEIVRANAEEGLVVKDPMANYRRSKVSGWWKMVPDDNEDGKVVGLCWGSEGKANEGKVIGFEVLLESGHVVNACKISRKLMDEFTTAVGALCKVPADWKYAKQGVEKYNPFMGWTCRVTFMERYPDGSMRHPSFDEFRGISDPLIKE
ncbi:MAG: hypothetical protein ACOH2R_17505 [Pseudomonas sp.]